jgi:hypothetical protein
MITDLQTSFMTRYNSAAGDTLRGLSQGMWESEGPSSLVLGTQAGQELQSSTGPFITFEVILTGLAQDFCSNMFEPLVQFTVFGDGNNKSSAAVLALGDEFLSVFGDQLFTMANGYTMIRNDTVGQRKFKDQNKMWNLVYELQFIIEKDR